jgi:hypothetical protein
MNYKICITLACLIFSAFGNNVSSQTVARSEDKSTPTSAGSTNMAEDEKLIRSAYEKLTLYNRAEALYHFKGKTEDLPSEAFLQFELKNFRFGPIEEILNLSAKDLLPQKDGDFIDIGSNIRTENGSDQEASYSAKWNLVKSEIAYHLPITIGDYLKIAASESLGVSRYASYDVTVSLKGRSRTYPAMVFFYKSDDSAPSPRFSFFDKIGTGNLLHDVLEQKLPPLKRKGSSS